MVSEDHYFRDQMQEEQNKKSNKQNKSLVWFMRFMSVQAHMFILELFYHHF